MEKNQMLNGFQGIKGTPRCACCNTFVSKKNICQFPEALLPLLNNPFEMGICPYCFENRTQEELQNLLTNKFSRTMSEPKKEILANVIDINSIVKSGRRGVTNTQIIPVLKEALDNNDIEKVKLLKTYFDKVVEASLRYLGEKRRTKFKNIRNIG